MINTNYNNLQNSYLFSTIGAKVRDYKTKHPEADVISLGIGDVTQPLTAPVIAAMNGAVAEMAVKETFRGYSPDCGYDFLRSAISDYYGTRGTDVPVDDIVVTDGAKSDCGNILDIFAHGVTAVIPDPVYPVYLDTNVMAGNKTVFVNGTADNGFTPDPPKMKADIAYICSPNNPTGAVFSREKLGKWVDWANGCGAVILFDAAYEAFISDPSLPRSIYEIPGAKTCAIELCSFSKTAGFTGVRCGWTVVPHELIRGGVSLRSLWIRRQATKFNGVGYVVQRAAAAALSEDGVKAGRAVINGYMENAAVISAAVEKAGLWHSGGENSPYVWLQTPRGMGSWDFFELLLSKCAVVGTPGAGFGVMGEGFFRLTAFGDKERTVAAAARMAGVL